MSVLRDCLSARRRSGGMLTCERWRGGVAVASSPCYRLASPRVATVFLRGGAGFPVAFAPFCLRLLA